MSDENFVGAANVASETLRNLLNSGERSEAIALMVSVLDLTDNSAAMFSILCGEMVQLIAELDLEGFALEVDSSLRPLFSAYRVFGRTEHFFGSVMSSQLGLDRDQCLRIAVALVIVSIHGLGQLQLHADSQREVSEAQSQQSSNNPDVTWNPETGNHHVDDGSTAIPTVHGWVVPSERMRPFFEEIRRIEQQFPNESRNRKRWRKFGL